jgi:tRNA (adenine57-N1/adenine58-N1)-methyltransferase
MSTTSPEKPQENPTETPFQKREILAPPNALEPLRQSAMKDSDFIIVFFDPSSQNMIKLDATQKLNTRFGPISHTNFIGQKYGSKIYADSKMGYVFAFRPDRAFFTGNQRHRTQILYAPDISMTIFYLGITTNSIVVESGTGSGSMSYSISKALGQAGHLYTFEFNEERATEVAKDFTRANRFNIT